MSKGTNKVFGVPTKDNTTKISFTGTTSATDIIPTALVSATGGNSGGFAVRIVAKANCFISFGPSTETATDESVFLVANVPEIFSFAYDEPYLAVISDGVSADLYATVLNKGYTH